jgi:hypothetical protein
VVGDPTLNGGVAVLAGNVISEQAGRVVHCERNRVELEDVLVDVAVCQLSGVDRQAHSALEFAAPAAFVVQDLVAQRARAVVVFGDRAEQHAAAAGRTATHSNQLCMMARRRGRPRGCDSAGISTALPKRVAAFLEDGELQVFARTEVGEDAALGHADRQRRAVRSRDLRTPEARAISYARPTIDSRVAAPFGVAVAWCSCGGQ